MGTPDTGMTPLGTGYGTMQDRYPKLWKMVSDRTPATSKWLPTKLPDGNYSPPNGKFEEVKVDKTCVATTFHGLEGKEKWEEFKEDPCNCENLCDLGQYETEADGFFDDGGEEWTDNNNGGGPCNCQEGQFCNND